MGQFVHQLRDIQRTPLQRITTDGGDVLHGLKRSEDSFRGFGEAYFSWIRPGITKPWRCHLRMTMNLVVPVGTVRFVFHDQKASKQKLKISFREELIGTDNDGDYARLMVPPGFWCAFQCMSKTSSLIMNLADIEHDPDEVLHRPLGAIAYAWDQP